ncbi:MAG: lamin tail domain-containing protein [Saprospiraceae bacterium]|nr:lamin tail domain-containing protein [Saprospiraceae bacterium]
MKKALHNLLMLFCLLFLGNAIGQNVIITEINYNSPGGGVDTFEYIELYNKGNAPVNLQGWEFVSGINYSFPSYDLNPGEFVVVAYDAARFNTAFGFTPLAWDPAGFNGLNNTSENIILVDADSAFVDSVRYKDNIPWPSAADGQGPSLVLCDFDADNGDPANWAAATTGTGFVSAGIEILANPGAVSGCASGPVVAFTLPSANVPENAGDVFLTVAINGGNANPTVVTLSLNPSSTATAGSDFTASFPLTITFDAGVNAGTQTVTIPVINDSDIEPNETVVIDITDATNGATIGSGTFTLTISDNDTPITSALVISGVFDAQPGGTGAKGVELKAIQNIPDLSIYGVGSASNGGGTDGVEILLPAIAVAEGECVYVAADSVLFNTYFGFNPAADGNGVSINGDDAIELFENGQVIDVFGDISYPSGSTLAWNYLDGWAYRKDGTGPGGSLFDINEWTINANALNGGTNNTDAPTPFPACDYSSVPPTTAELLDDDFTVDYNASATSLDVLSNDILPSAITSLTIVSAPTGGSATPNGTTDISYTPNAGFCGTDSFVYQVCDAGGCDEATVSITIECPATYPLYDLSAVTTVTGGAPDSLGVTCELRGIVYGIDYQGVSLQGDLIPAIQFYLNDGNGGSLSVFGTQSFAYTVKEGDDVSVRGKIVNFNCLTQVSELDTIIYHSSNNPLLPPNITTFLDESFEAELVKFTNMQIVDPTDWGPQTPTATGFNVELKSVVNPTGPSIFMRIDNDCPWFTQPAPTVPFHATGLAGQFVSGGGGGCVDGYQFFPRYVSDIELLSSVKESALEGKINCYPTPVSDVLYFNSEIIIEDIVVSNALGQQLTQIKHPSNAIQVGQLQAGIYLISFRAEGAVWTTKFVKE